MSHNIPTIGNPMTAWEHSLSASLKTTGTRGTLVDRMLRISRDYILRNLILFIKIYARMVIKDMCVKLTQFIYYIHM